MSIDNFLWLKHLSFRGRFFAPILCMGNGKAHLIKPNEWYVRNLIIPPKYKRRCNALVVFIQENTFQNVVWKMATIFFLAFIC